MGDTDSTKVLTVVTKDWHLETLGNYCYYHLSMKRYSLLPSRYCAEHRSAVLHLLSGHKRGDMKHIYTCKELLHRSGRLTTMTWALSFPLIYSTLRVWGYHGWELPFQEARTEEPTPMSTDSREADKVCTYIIQVRKS